MSINDQFDMSVFDGTIYEGLTYLQVRRRMTPAQLKRWKHINKCQARVKKLDKAIAETNYIRNPSTRSVKTVRG